MGFGETLTDNNFVIFISLDELTNMNHFVGFNGVTIMMGIKATAVAL